MVLLTTLHAVSAEPAAIVVIPHALSQDAPLYPMVLTNETLSPERVLIIAEWEDSLLDNAQKAEWADRFVFKVSSKELNVFTRLLSSVQWVKNPKPKDQDISFYYNFCLYEHGDNGQPSRSMSAYANKDQAREIFQKMIRTAENQRLRDALEMRSR
jgi:hypothetical protein